jgi:hypothetical protein
MQRALQTLQARQSRLLVEAHTCKHLTPAANIFDSTRGTFSNFQFNWGN